MRTCSSEKQASDLETSASASASASLICKKLSHFNARRNLFTFEWDGYLLVLQILVPPPPFYSRFPPIWSYWHHKFARIKDGCQGCGNTPEVYFQENLSSLKISSFLWTAFILKGGGNELKKVTVNPPPSYFLRTPCGAHEVSGLILENWSACW